MPIEKIKGLQGNLKELPPENFEKLKKSILKHGFAFPVNLARLNGEPYGILDAHQRVKVVIELVNQGYTLVNEKDKEVKSLPVTYTDVKNKQQAGELILQAVSQYGKITDEGLAEFMEEFDISNINVFDLEGYTKTSKGSLKKTLDSDSPTLEVKYPIMILQNEKEYNLFDALKKKHKTKVDEKMFSIILNHFLNND